jgi:hypothetical protein
MKLLNTQKVYKTVAKVQIINLAGFWFLNKTF